MGDLCGNLLDYNQIIKICLKNEFECKYPKWVDSAYQEYMGN